VPVVLTCCESPGGPPDRHGASRIPRYPGRDRQLCDPFGGESTRMMCFHSSCCSPMLLHPLLLLLLLLPLSSFALLMADPISFGRVPSGSRIARQLRRAACRVWLRHQCGKHCRHPRYNLLSVLFAVASSSPLSSSGDDDDYDDPPDSPLDKMPSSLSSGLSCLSTPLTSLVLTHTEG
jgi:hypothetical protein